MSISSLLEINLKKEEELLLYGLRMGIFSVVSPEMKTLLQQEIDWDYFLNIAGNHGVIPLLYQNINQNCSNLFPEKFILKLRQYYQNNALRNLFLSKELLKLIAILQQHNINALPYKGPVLASYLYGNIALRCCTDIDLLIPTKDFINVKNILSTKGYKLVSLVSKEDKFKAPLHWGHEYVLSTFNEKILIDVHQSIARSDFFFPFDINSLWDNLTKINFLGTELNQISPENLLLILVAHGSKHRWENLIWLFDLATLITLNPHLNFEQFFQKSHKLSNERMLLLSLYLCQKIFNIKLTENINKKINSDSTLKALSENIINNMFLKKDSNVLERSMSSFNFYYKLRNTLLGKLQQLGATISFIVNPNLRDWDFFPLPNYLYFLYYFIRPLRLISRQAK